MSDLTEKWQKKSAAVGDMSDDIVIAEYLAACAHKPVLCDEQVHGKWKLRLKDEIAERGLALPEGTSKKVIGTKPTHGELHQLLTSGHGRRSGTYVGPKGHPVPTAKIDEIVLVQDESPATTAEVIDLPQAVEGDSDVPLSDLVAHGEPGQRVAAAG